MKSAFSKEYRLFLELLIEHRGAIGMTQQTLAKRLSKPQSFVSKYERGERRLDFAEFMLICRALAVNPVEFVAEYLTKLGRTRGSHR
jgi:transcriptional regulator with XRE-family HTH domain